MKKNLFFIVLLTGMMNFLNAQYSCEKWSVLDISITSGKTSAKPLDVEFGAVFSQENGKRLNIPAFYNGDNTWVLRFSPSETGEWTFRTWSSERSLAGKTGTVSVLPSGKEDEHGPLVISKKNPQKFEYADGTPVYLMTFEIDWLFALDHDNPADIPKTRQIVSHIKENGFNQVVMNVYAYDAGWGERESIRPEHNFAKPDVFPFGGSNETPDYTTLNIDFFRHLDRVIAHLDDQEILAHLMIYVWNKKVNWPEPGSKADNMYFDYVVKRYQAFPNLIWDISKEALAYGRDDMGYISQRIDRLRKLDAYGRLLSVHDYAYCNAFPEKVDFISIQNWSPNIYDIMRDVKEKHSGKPILNIEHGGYEKTMHSIFDGAFTDAVACLDRNYQCAFAGTYSTYYWQNASWYELVYNPFELPAQNQPRFEYFRYMTELFTRYPFEELEPYQGDFTSFILTNSDDVYMVYLTPDMISISGNIIELKGSTVDITWFDPLTGTYFPGGERNFGGTWMGIRRPGELSGPIGIAILKARQP